MAKYNYLLEFICCPKCRGSLNIQKNSLICTGCKKKFLYSNGIPRLLLDLPPDAKLSLNKWEKYYEKQLKSGKYESEFNEYLRLFQKDSYNQLLKVNKKKSPVYLEIGCGPLFLGQTLAKECRVIIGIDFCRNALLVAQKMLEKKGIKNYLLIQGDILNMPIKDKSIELIYGGGVIEHFKDTQLCVNELSRILKKGGISFNTVPYLNIGSLTYRQVWGNIPNVFPLRQLAEFVHIKLLGARHMTYGYEYSFLGTSLKKIHKKAGFKRTRVEKFDVFLYFEFAPKILRAPFIWLAKNSPLFWPMIKVIAEK